MNRKHLIRIVETSIILSAAICISVNMATPTIAYLGNVDRQVRMAQRCKENGEYKQAAQWYRKAAEQGHKDAAYALRKLESL